MSAIWMAVSRSEAETEAIASALAQGVTPGMALLLSGDLGAGKSVFARGVIRGLGVKEAWITSPTFTLVNVYSEGRMPVCHFDLYRLTSPDDLDLLGLEEYVNGHSLLIVEWPEQGGDSFFGDPLQVRLSYVESDPEARQISLVPLGPQSQETVNAFQYLAPAG
ncbi:MAG: tRNA (adenosine(37)-N6)-threonylcarbamoyltransferase complex ATPase subunit type 1 TsaE [Magnetococcus sp. YQC-5]